MKTKIIRLAGIMVILIGMFLFLFPDISTWYQKKQNRSAIEAFDENFRSPGTEADDVGNDDDSNDGDNDRGDDDQKPEQIFLKSVFYDSSFDTINLLGKIQDYNRKLYENGQADFRDAWSVTQSPNTISELENRMFGYIEIPAMEVSLPIYIGASTSNMAKGAAVLGATSIPIGGENTNSVIAGHRGYRGVAYFREIEKLQPDDPVYVTNPWGTLGYRVESIDIISPTDSDAVKIQEGKDMITLITCHPYRSHGKYRYVVYCVRDESLEGGSEAEVESAENGDLEESAAKNTEEENRNGYIEASDGILYPSSEEDIRTEELLRKGGAALILCMVLITFFRVRRSKRNY